MCLMDLGGAARLKAARPNTGKPPTRGWRALGRFCLAERVIGVLRVSINLSGPLFEHLASTWPGRGTPGPEGPSTLGSLTWEADMQQLEFDFQSLFPMI